MGCLSQPIDRVEGAHEIGQNNDNPARIVRVWVIDGPSPGYALALAAPALLVVRWLLPWIVGSWLRRYARAFAADG